MGRAPNSLGDDKIADARVATVESANLQNDEAWLAKDFRAVKTFDAARDDDVGNRKIKSHLLHGTFRCGFQLIIERDVAQLRFDIADNLAGYGGVKGSTFNQTSEDLQHKRWKKQNNSSIFRTSCVSKRTETNQSGSPRTWRARKRRMTKKRGDA